MLEDLEHASFNRSRPRDGLNQALQKRANFLNFLQQALSLVVVHLPVICAPFYMTIHTKWMELLRMEAKDAFHYGECPCAPHASFCDGQIKLMGSTSSCWADFLHSKFTSTLMRHFEVYGCRTVVLAFDDKRHVPKAKSITQRKRRDGVKIIEFGEADVLPADMPAQWKEAIMNPWFKHRVIQLVCANVPRLISPPDGSRLIIDWETTKQYEYRDGQDPTESIVDENASVGEADLKFPRWMTRLDCPMLVEATDGDYIGISLGIKASGCNQPVVLLKAWTLEMGPEFVLVDAIHAFIRTACLRAARGRPLPENSHWEIKLFIVMLGLSGTDFTRNLPLISPTKMWDALPLLVQTFAMDTDTTIDLDQGRRIVELLYAEAFPKHIDPYVRRSVWSQAQASKLGQRNKALIPTDSRIVCTLRNINFLMAYWLTFEPPRAIESFGFRLGNGGVVEWDD